MADIYVFASYAHSDNDALYGRIGQICNDISRTFRSLSGYEVDTFFDVQSISLGDRWRERIEAGLASSTILFAFISPAYLRSEPCREEFTRFMTYLGRERSLRLIIPLILVDSQIIDRRFHDDEMWREIKELQYLSIGELRAVDPGSTAWMRIIHVIAERMDRVVEENLGDPQAVSVDIDVDRLDDDDVDSRTPGRLEKLSLLESELPTMNEEITRFSEILTAYGEKATDITPQMRTANSFSRRLAVANRFAESISSLTDESVELSTRLRSRLANVDSGIVEAIRMVGLAPASDLADPGVRKFVKDVKLMATGGIDAADQLETFKRTVETTKGFSGPLDKVLKRMQSSLLVMIDAKAIFLTWLQELERIDPTLGEDFWNVS